MLYWEETSKTRKIKNGVPQGSVLAPTLFNVCVYISDMPNTHSVKLGYADDWALAHQSKDWNEIEETLSQDTTAMKKFFDHWYLKMNTTKTVSTVFHLDNKQANRTLKIQVEEKILPHDKNPKYLGVTLDRALTYKKHLEDSSNKIGKRNCLIRKLARTTWGAKQTVLRTTTLALSYSVAEYCAPVWMRSAHTNLIDVKLRESMRTITGSLRSTPNQWLPVMSAIAPPHLRREEANQTWIQRAKDSEQNIPLKEIFNNAPKTSRLKSRKPFYKSEIIDFNTTEAWKTEWTNDTPRGGDLITDPTQRLPGFQTGKRKYWVYSNRLRSKHGRTAANMHRWGLRDSPTCPRCQEAPQDTDHLVIHCPETRLEGGYETVNSFDEAFTSWIDKNKLEV